MSRSRRASQPNCNRSTRCSASRIRVIPNGIDLNRFARDTAAGLRIRQEFGIPVDARLLLFAGHEFRRKGLAHAIGALERLGPDVWMLVVGSDNPAPYRKLATTSANRLVFAGSRTDMPALYAAADAFVLPTAYETFSLVCMEAMACSTPVFATPVGGIEDYLVDGVNGYQIKMDGADIADEDRDGFLRSGDTGAAVRRRACHGTELRLGLCRFALHRAAGAGAGVEERICAGRHGGRRLIASACFKGAAGPLPALHRRPAGRPTPAHSPPPRK